jgi:RNA polymerase sigma factor for flagellar operon FliA
MAMTPQIAMLWQEYWRTGTPTQRDQLLVHYAPLVLWVLGRLPLDFPDEVPREDILTIGTLALKTAIERAAPEDHGSFELVAQTRIRRALLAFSDQLALTLEEFDRILTGMRIAELTEDVAGWLQGPASSAGKETDRTAVQRALILALHQLSEPEQLVIALYHQEELTFPEMGKVLDVPPTVVRERYVQAMFRLRARLLPYRKAA